MATVVLADDHTLVRAGLRRILETTGNIVVGEAGDGLEVIPVVEATRPEVLGGSSQKGIRAVGIFGDHKKLGVVEAGDDQITNLGGGIVAGEAVYIYSLDGKELCRQIHLRLGRLKGNNCESG